MTLSSNQSQDFLAELKWRGLFNQATDETTLAHHLSTGVRRGYIGFDPTADSLTIGNLIQIILLAHFQRAGHSPIVLAGGGTGLIGDPSGKSAERELKTPEIVAHNVECQKTIFSRILDFSASRPNKATIVNNLDWLGKISFLDALRDIGKFFSVNEMMKKDSVKDRLHNRDQGISFTEFSYQILQAYDYLHLYETHGVTLQMGGSDQWGNITAGISLIRKKLVSPNNYMASVFKSLANDDAASGNVSDEQWAQDSSEGLSATADSVKAHAVVSHLVTKADGGKFGKSESGAIWLTAGDGPNRTSPFAFYQFWLNSADADVARFLRFFTFLSHAEIEALEASHAANPGAREAHRALAQHMTALLHGETEAKNAEAAAKALFSGEIASLPATTLRDVLAGLPTSTHDKASLGVPLVDLLVTTKLATSKREAREFLANGSVTLNGRKVGPDDAAKSSDLLHEGTIALRRGKKNWHVTIWR